MPEQCQHCGGELVRAHPVAIYCPNPACWREELRKSRLLYQQWLEQREQAELARLQDKYGEAA